MDVVQANCRIVSDLVHACGQLSYQNFNSLSNPGFIVKNKVKCIYINIVRPKPFLYNKPTILVTNGYFFFGFGTWATTLIKTQVEKLNLGRIYLPFMDQSRIGVTATPHTNGAISLLSSVSNHP